MSHKKSATTTLGVVVALFLCYFCDIVILLCTRTRISAPKIWFDFSSHTERGNVPLGESSLEKKRRMPLQPQIIGQYQFLGAEIKGKK